jgi:hypothetical protein
MTSQNQSRQVEGKSKPVAESQNMWTPGLRDSGTPGRSATGNTTQRDTVLSLVMAFVIVLLLVQLWLLVEAVEGHVGETGTIILPAAVASGFCCLAASWLWRTSRHKL